MTEPNMPIPGESAWQTEPPAETPGSEDQTPAAPSQAAGSGDQAAESDSQDATAEPPRSSGDPRVDEAIAGLDAAADAPPAEQVAAYESAHRVLQDTLATIDEA